MPFGRLPNARPFFNVQFDSNLFGLLRSEEHTSELQSQSNLVCRLLLEKKTPEADPTRRRRPSARCLRLGRTSRTERCECVRRGRSLPRESAPLPPGPPMLDGALTDASC